LTVQSSKSQKVINKTINSLLNAAIKAGIGGGIAAALLLLVNQIAFPLLRTVLIPPAFVTVWIVTGIAAAAIPALDKRFELPSRNRTSMTQIKRISSDKRKKSVKISVIRAICVLSATLQPVHTENC